ncbi:hypothetical protein [Umezawaea sp. Da 62-37]|uniref:hypothetical protein n=1 Tax=Umezawaea sp. Da 62-37 TaxID=3075927 RepID=UPI0028F6FEC8|nr:hypothetical protein [Umezawaea sp. Da 62-37]WNV85102.1 hypothetical protein RM788_44335 [Umezawaea sp. Da 62-37]
MPLTPVVPIARWCLALGATRVAPGALSVLTLAGGVTIDPCDRGQLRFGRNRPEVEVCVGENDVMVSRRHGLLEHLTGAGG